MARVMRGGAARPTGAIGLMLGLGAIACAAQPEAAGVTPGESAAASAAASTSPATGSLVTSAAASAPAPTPAQPSARGAAIERDPGGRLVVSADADTPYREVVQALDAAVGLGAGADLAFAAPRGATLGRAPKGAPDGALPLLPGGLTKPQQFVVVRVSKTKITVGEGDAPAVTYASGSLGGEGLPLSSKPAGEQSLFVEPLAKALAAAHGQAAKVKPAPGGIALLLAADETTPYRVLFEVLFTASLSGYERFHLLVRAP